MKTTTHQYAPLGMITQDKCSPGVLIAGIQQRAVNVKTQMTCA